MFGDLDNLVVEDGEDEDREDASGEEGMEYLIDDASFDIILLMIAGHGERSLPIWRTFGRLRITEAVMTGKT